MDSWKGQLEKREVGKFDVRKFFNAVLSDQKISNFNLNFEIGSRR